MCRTSADTLVLHSDVFLIPFEEEGFPVPAYFGEACRIPKSKIKSFTITSMTECSVLYNTGPQLTLEDQWVQGPIFHKDDLGQPLYLLRILLCSPEHQSNCPGG
jgi:hypothetical protein